MDAMKRAVFPALLLASLAYAESFSGTVVDVMCRGKDLAGHTRDARSPAPRAATAW